MDDSTKDKVLQQLDRNRIIEISKNLAETISITGEEYNVAHYLGSEFEKLGMTVKYQEVEEGRPTVIGTLQGSICGRGLVNMKAAFPCYIVAVEMLQKAGVELKGDIIISGVVGEIEKAQVNRFSGKTCRGAGVGARYMMDHGVTADMCIIGEPTGLQLQIGNAGLIWAEVTVDGKAENFVIQAGKVAQAIQDWEKEYQQEYKHPFMLPTVQIGAIDGGNPFKPGRSEEHTSELQ